MGIFDGPLFEISGDGKTDVFEFALAMNMIKALEKDGREQKKENSL